MQRSCRGQPALTTGTEDVKRARNRRIKMCEEMRPKSLAKEKLYTLKRFVEINGRQNIPKVDDSTEIGVMGENSLRRKMFQFGGTGGSSR